jgi:hypothetical protein
MSGSKRRGRSIFKGRLGWTRADWANFGMSALEALPLTAALGFSDAIQRRYALGSIGFKLCLTERRFIVGAVAAFPVLRISAELATE